MDRERIRQEIADRTYRGSSSEATDGTGPRRFIFENLFQELDRDVIRVIAYEADRLGVSSFELVAKALEEKGHIAVSAYIEMLNETD